MDMVRMGKLAALGVPNEPGTCRSKGFTLAATYGDGAVGKSVFMPFSGACQGITTVKFRKAPAVAAAEMTAASPGAPSPRGIPGGWRPGPQAGAAAAPRKASVDPSLLGGVPARNPARWTSPKFDGIPKIGSGLPGAPGRDEWGRPIPMEGVEALLGDDEDAPPIEGRPEPDDGGLPFE
mmetsp:Transcript_47528/g.134160  ORF Transcript_47528/g.134160 Transcript_47528/m.134160 type:complete len:179 (-) Transcript_47528:60-596(-)